MLVKVTAPTVAIGVLLLLVCVVSAWYTTRVQTNLTNILKNHVASLRAAQQLEIHAGQLRLYCFVFLVAPGENANRQIAQAEARFEYWLKKARELAQTETELVFVRDMTLGYDRYRREFSELKADILLGKQPWQPRDLADLNPVKHIIDPCRGFFNENEQMMNQTAAESESLSGKLYLAMLLLGVGGPLSGLLSGYGIARGLSRSLHRLSVRVQDVSQHLEQHVASVSLAPDGDIQHIDEQLQRVVRRVEEVAERLQRQQRDLLRAQQLSAVGQLAACVAHEIRNPLTAVKMLVEVALRNRNPKPLTGADLRVIHGELDRVEKTVQNLLDFARLPAPRRAVCDLREVVGQAGDLVRARARQQGVELTVRCPEQPAPADVDRGQLCTVLVNLFLNALDAMPHGGTLEADLEANGTTGARLRVTDTGGGVPPEMLADLFTPFASSKPTGTGLGLSISKRIVEEHGGTICVANRVRGQGTGACFVVTLPSGLRLSDLVARIEDRA
jgi:signal transduction histidine kinase